MLPGEGAFYGPKIGFDFRDVLERAWKLATVQLDCAMPERFDLNYVTPEGTEATPVMIHRAVLGSIERFIAILLEHTAGSSPLWLAPVQVRVVPVSEKVADYARRSPRRVARARASAPRPTCATRSSATRSARRSSRRSRDRGRRRAGGGGAARSRRAPAAAAQESTDAARRVRRAHGRAEARMPGGVP